MAGASARPRSGGGGARVPGPAAARWSFSGARKPRRAFKPRRVDRVPKGRDRPLRRRRVMTLKRSIIRRAAVSMALESRHLQPHSGSRDPVDGRPEGERRLPWPGPAPARPVAIERRPVRSADQRSILVRLTKALRLRRRFEYRQTPGGALAVRIRARRFARLAKPVPTGPDELSASQGVRGDRMSPAR